MRGKLYIHIGPHKTGTTSLQHFLFQERSLLLAEGILFPSENLGPWFTQHRLAFALRGVADRKLGDSPDADTELANVVRQSRLSGAETVVLSAESFSLLSIEAMQKLKDAFHGYETRVVLYARPQDECFISAFSQRIKSPVKSATAPLEVLLDREISAYRSDIHLNAARWASVFGQSNIIVRVYTEVRDIREDFITLVGGNTLAEKMVQRLPGKKNASPSLEVLEILHVFKQVEPDPEIRSRAMFLLTNYFSERGRKAIYLISTADRRQILEKFRASNELLFSEFLGRNNAFAPEILLANVPEVERSRIDTSNAVALTQRLLKQEQSVAYKIRRALRSLSPVS